MNWFRRRDEYLDIDPDASEEEIEKLVEKLFERLEVSSYSAIQDRQWWILLKEKRARWGFERRLRKRWGKAFESYDMLRAYSLQIGQHIQADRSKDQQLIEDHTYEALFRVHARSILLASEIHALLTAGHSSGALSRWRSMHELAVISFFLTQHGAEVSERYLLHARIKTAKHMRQYQNYADRLGFEPLTASEVEGIEAERVELLEKYGKSFGDDYGWASSILPGRVQFSQIEKAVELDQWRPFVSLASESVHGGFRGMIADIGNMNSTRSRNLMLAGPSNAGLADPGQCAAMSLTSCATCLATYNPQPEYVVMLRVLQRLMGKTVEEFIIAHNQLEADEAKYSPKDS